MGISLIPLISICYHSKTPTYIPVTIASRDWSLITGRGGGATKREGVHVKFYPYKKGVRGRFSHAEGWGGGGGGTKSIVVFMQ